MEKYRITTAEAEAIKAAMRNCRRRLGRASKDKTACGSDMDGWHDEMFKINMEDEAQATAMFRHLKRVLDNAEIIEPEEQADTVQLGNAVVIDFDDGGPAETLLIVGYQIDSNGQGISLKSALGQALIGAKEGETKEYSVENTQLRAKVLKIYPPSFIREVTMQDG